MISDLSLKDYVDRRPLEALQLERLRLILTHAYRNSPFYTRAFDQAQVTPADLKRLADLAKFPFTCKTDLRDNYPFGLNAVPNEEIVRVHASSGTTGKPIVVTYTKDDIAIWSETAGRCFRMGGLTSRDRVLVSYGYSLFTGGMGAHQGAERIGATVVPMGGGNSEKQLMLIRDLGITAICCTPSFFIHLMEVAKRSGMDFRQTQLRHGFFGAEPWSDNMRERIERETGIRAHDIFGMSEIMGPGVAGDCEARNGLHIFEDHYLPEIVDPQTGEVLPPGSEGELVLTTLDKMAMPLIRYRTHDLTTLRYEQCSCGRTIVRMERVKRRCDDMLIIRGVNLFPSQIESILLTIEGIEPHYQIIVTRENAMDDLEIRVEVTPAVFSDAVRNLEQLRTAIQAKIKHLIGLSAKITLVEPGAIERSAGKARHVIDMREK